MVRQVNYSYTKLFLKPESCGIFFSRDELQRIQDAAFDAKQISPKCCFCNHRELGLAATVLFRPCFSSNLCVRYGGAMSLTQRPQVAGLGERGPISFAPLSPGQEWLLAILRVFMGLYRQSKWA